MPITPMVGSSGIGIAKQSGGTITTRIGAGDLTITVSGKKDMGGKAQRLSALRQKPQGHGESFRVLFRVSMKS
jgi:hypothetical protein